MTLDSDVFVAPLTGDMDMTRLVIAAILFAAIAIVALRKLQKMKKEIHN